MRRPHRGIEVKEDTYAALKVIRADGTEIRLVDSSSFWGMSVDGYSNFILQNVQEARMEKHQIIETFGASYVFFFGEAPRFLTISSILLNTHDFNWEAEWWANYNTYLRGTRLVEEGARCYLFYDDNIIEGYIINAQAVKQSMQPHHVSLSFKFFVTNCNNISMEGDIAQFPVRASVQLPDGIELGDGDAWRRIISTLRGDSASAAAGRNVSNAMGLAFAGKSTDARLSSAVRNAAATISPDPESWPTLFPRQSGVVNPGKDPPLRPIPRRGMPLRGLIAENVDEYTGLGLSQTYNTFGAGDPSLPMKRHVTRTLQESDDAFRQAIEALTCFGANINGPEPLLKLGLGPNFLKGKKLDAATFKAIATDPFGYNTAKEQLYEPIQEQASSFDKWSRGGGYQRLGAQAQESASRFGDGILRAHDPLGLVYGGREEPQESLVTNSRYTEGAGDPLYGYPSDYAEGPGFGQTGFGTFGGNGFGSGSGSGDPGYKDPNRFTFAGVSDDREAWDRFMLPQDDDTALTGSDRDRRGTNSGGASIEVGGEMSAFSLISVDGILTPEGNARSQVEAIRERQEATRFGFSVDNPYGVQCPDEPGTLTAGGSFSEGFNHSLP